MLICMAVSILYHESILPFLWPILISIAIGATCFATGMKANKYMGRRDGYIVVTASWLLFSLIGMLPFLFGNVIPDVAGAFLESMSGYTSTGSTVIDNVDAVPKGILFWRSMTQWVGGIGIVFFTIAILPAFGVGEIKLFAAESTGPIHDKVHPRISIAARWIGSVYLCITLLCVISLILCGMNLFDAVNFAMTTTATGGMSTHSALIHDVFNSPSIEYVLTFFMFISGMNYTLIYYTILKGKFKKLFKDSELRCYLLIVLGASAACTLGLMMQRGWDDLELAFRESIFTIVSLQTTTGFGSCDYTIWPPALMHILLFVMFAGACSGSTSGGFKCIRITMLHKVLENELMRILHPRAVIPVKVNNGVISNSVVKSLIAFFALNIVIIVIGTFALKLCGVDTCSCYNGLDSMESLSLTISSLSNAGPGMGYYGPTHSYATLSPLAKYICSFLMLIGRLEIFPVLILFTKNFWKKA